MSNRKVLLADLHGQAKERFLALEPAEAIKEFLKNNGAYQREVDRIYREVKREVRKEFTEQVETWVKQGETDEEIREKLMGKLPDDLREQVISGGRQTATNALQNEVYRMTDLGMPAEKIVAECTGPLADRQTILQWIERRIAQKEAMAEEESGGGRSTGVIILVAGLVLTFGSMFMADSSGTYSVFYGAILYGLFKIIKG